MAKEIGHWNVQFALLSQISYLCNPFEELELRQPEHNHYAENISSCRCTFFAETIARVSAFLFRLKSFSGQQLQ